MGWAETVARSRAPDVHEEFRRRVSAQAGSVREALTAGAFEGGYHVGLELEGYAVDDEGRLATVPDAVFGDYCERELGRHNAEMNTPATPFNPEGVAAQTERLAERLETVRDALAARGRRFVTDGMWTVEPPEGALTYLTATHEEAGRRVPTNMSPDGRYYALDADITAAGGVELSVPGCRRTFSSILVESLTASTQIHLQTPPERFARYFNAALRTTGPVLALGANSPFLPPSLYTDPATETVLSAGVELRVPAFETLNVRDPGKVRFPDDVADAGAAVDRIADDRRCAPYLREWVADGPRDDFRDEHWELLHKGSTCWRWVRPVLGPTGPRIEYRVLAAQPSVPDVTGFQALVAGLVHGVVVTDHPLPDLSWAAARESFYAAVQDGLDADLAWLTRDGDRVDDPERVYPDLFAVARAGLRDRGFEDETIDDLLAPVERRWTERTTPATWKRAWVRDRLDDGADLAAAIEATQQDYVDRTATDAPFVDW
jgi:hypothetical protein